MKRLGCVYGSHHTDMVVCACVNSCTSADITAFFKGMQVVGDGIFLCTHADGRPTGEVGDSLPFKTCGLLVD